MCARGRCSRESFYHIPYKRLLGSRPVANLFANIFNNNNNNNNNETFVAHNNISTLCTIHNIHRIIKKNKNEK